MAFCRWRSTRAAANWAADKAAVSACAGSLGSLAFAFSCALALGLLLGSAYGLTSGLGFGLTLGLGFDLRVFFGSSSFARLGSSSSKPDLLRGFGTSTT
eukprot:Skav229990  [mRNA]  locus=scaffold4047:40815:50212:- [translate_table: standard]